MKLYRYILLAILCLGIGYGVFMYLEHRSITAVKPLHITTPQEAQAAAQEWVQHNALTYTYDGTDLTLLETRTLDCPGCFSTTFTFTSAHSGFGYRANVVTLQALTPHIIEVIFKNNQLDSVTTDGEFDEINQKNFVEKQLMSVDVYFGNSKQNTNQKECGKVYPIERITEEVRPPYRSAVEQLLAGPTDKEKKEGLFTSINPGVRVNSLSVNSGIARVDFSSELTKNVAGSCKVTTIKAQIEATLKQFPDIHSIIISVNGKIDTVLQP